MKVKYINYLIYELFKIQSFLKFDDDIANKSKIGYLNLQINNIFMKSEYVLDTKINDDYDPSIEFNGIPETKKLLSYKNWLIKRRNEKIRNILSTEKS